ncbi:hypothetical protein, partial [Vibrio bivalvicida]
MNSHKYNDHNQITSLTPFQKSKTAFLIEGLDTFDAENKPYHVDEWDFSTSHKVGVICSSQTGHFIKRHFVV